MANTDNARGLRPIYGPGGGAPKMTKYLAGTTTSIFRGDIVARAANGRVHRIATTTGSGKIVGVAANYVNALSGVGATTAQDVWVYDDPDQSFEIQDDGAAATPARSDLGATFALIVGVGNTTTGQSIFEVDASAAGVASTDPVLAIDFKVGPAFEVGKNATWIIKLNRHLHRTASLGI